MNNTYNITSAEEGIRVDKYLASETNNMSRSYIQDLIEQDEIKVNGIKVKSSYIIKKGDTITLNIPEPVEMKLEPKEMDLNIIYEDSDIVIINKPHDLIVHPTPHNKTDTLVNALLSYTDDLSGIGGVKRPGIVHRLDKDTSGAIVVAKNDISHRYLVRQFKERKTSKTYYSLVKGDIKHNKGKINAPIGRDPSNRTKMTVIKNNSKKAVSYFKVLERFTDYTLVQIKLETGRTHQIRVHMSFMGNPVLGDLKYGNIDKNFNCSRQMLHSYQLGLYHPKDRQWMEFTAPLPEDFQNTLNKLKNKA